MHAIGFVVFPRFDLLAFSAVTALQTANRVLSGDFYEVTLLSEHGGPVMASAGFRVETRPFGDAVFDTVLLATGIETDAGSPGLYAFVRRALGSARRVVAPCTGAFLLAEAGVLDGRHATTHWRFARDLQQRFPKVRVDDDQIFVVDGPVWTSAGMAATLDLALALIEQDHGRTVSREVARRLVVYHRRAGGQPQISALLELEPKSDRIRKVLDHARAHLANALSVEELAEVAGLSPRQFSRAFSAETGRSPARAVEQLRVEAARVLLEQGRLQMDLIAREVGLVDRERMRRAFVRTLGQPPRTLRQASRAGRAAQAGDADMPPAWVQPSAA
ncbi:GlxA family transcriptional regulator [Azohydromonas australica]|uniref:GlxA family transcriptional regulator n=1 Tax=Azohydromonas australica TaxID=364039 RepID=UPI0004113438|nr:GlxA family transcriptional regulator [Azohydromonas australica]